MQCIVDACNSDSYPSVFTQCTHRPLPIAIMMLTMQTALLALLAWPGLGVAVTIGGPAGPADARRDVGAWPALPTVAPDVTASGAVTIATLTLTLAGDFVTVSRTLHAFRLVLSVFCINY